MLTKTWGIKTIMKKSVFTCNSCAHIILQYTIIFAFDNPLHFFNPILQLKFR